LVFEAIVDRESLVLHTSTSYVLSMTLALKPVAFAAILTVSGLFWYMNRCAWSSAVR